MKRAAGSKTGTTFPLPLISALDKNKSIAFTLVSLFLKKRKREEKRKKETVINESNTIPIRRKLSHVRTKRQITH